MKEHFIDAAISYVLNQMNDEEKESFVKNYKSLTDDEQAEISKIQYAVTSIPLSLELKTAPDSIKTNLFNEINKVSENVISLNNVKKSYQYIAIAASILITFIATRYYDLNRNLVISHDSIISTVSQVHDQEREKLNSALCVVAEASNMSHEDSKGVMHYGKAYFNKMSKSSVIHICFLPKLGTQKNYTLWLKNDDNKFEKLQIFEADQNINELNYLVKKEFYDSHHKLLVTLENNLDVTLPSNNVMLATL